MMFPDWQPIFAPEGDLLREGDPISQQALARTLQTIADEGPEAFYKVTIVFLSFCELMRFMPILPGTYR